MWKRRKKEKIDESISLDINPSVLNSGCRLEGVLQSNDAIRIDGQMRGEVYCLDRLIVGEKGKIIGQVFCQTVEVYGQIEGNINSVGIVSLHAGSKVRGNIRCNGLTVDSQADFHGICETKVDGLLLSPIIESFRVTENPPLSDPADSDIYNIKVDVQDEWDKLLKEKGLN